MRRLDHDVGIAGGEAKVNPTVFFVCYRPFDLRLILNTGIVDGLAGAANVVVLGPEVFRSEIEAILPPHAKFETLQYRTNKVQGTKDVSSGADGWRGIVRLFVEETARLVYAEKGGRRNITGDLHRRTYAESIATAPFHNRVFGWLVLGYSAVAWKFRPLRRLLQHIYFRVTRFNEHSELFKTYRPVLAVFASPGLSVDGWVMCEAIRHGARIAVIVQSWDKTSSKGYPVLPFDDLIVWSDVMKQEAEDFWDMPTSRVHVEGAPIWDCYFREDNLPSREAFLRERGLDSALQVIYVALAGPAWHNDNLALVRGLIQERQAGHLPQNINLYIRSHPNYLSLVFKRQLDELDALFAEFSNHQNVHFDKPQSHQGGNDFMLNAEYDRTLRCIFNSADVMLSVSSSQLIEAAIFDMPYVELKFGRWRNEVLDISLADFALEHSERIRATGAGPVAYSLKEAVQLLLEEMSDPARNRENRRRLVNQEVPTNRGCAAANTAKRIAAICAQGAALG